MRNGRIDEYRLVDDIADQQVEVVDQPKYDLSLSLSSLSFFIDG